jgi:SAM-dependent methyltransferase
MIRKRMTRLMMTELEAYYNKFNEEKRLNSRHGQVEFAVSMTYIKKYLDRIAEDKSKSPEDIKILDVGAGTGRYSVALADMGYDVTALELVKHNLGLLKAKKSSVKAYQGNAMKLKRFDDESFGLVLVFGPMYHLFGDDDKVKALSEAKRVVKKGGYILVAYVMNEYSVISYAFKEKHILEVIADGRLDEDFHTRNKPSDLYDYVRLEDIDRIRDACQLERDLIISADGAADYIRPYLNKLDDEEFKYFIDYQLAICERKELLGAGSHIVDILRKSL